MSQKNLSARNLSRQKSELTPSPNASLSPSSTIHQWNKPSPFLIPSIFESFSKYLSYYQLMEYRSVCKEWHNMINPIIEMSKGSLYIRTPWNAKAIEHQLVQSCPKRYDKIIVSQNFLTLFPLENFLQILLHKKLAYVSTLSLNNYQLSIKDWQKILCLLDPHLCVLKLDRCNFNTWPKADNRREDCNPFLMHAKDKHQYQIYQPKPLRKSSSWQKQIIRKFPNLKVLQYTDPNHVCITSIDEISTVFPELTELSFNTTYNYCNNKILSCPKIQYQQMSKLRRLSMKYSSYSGRKEKGYLKVFSKLSLMNLKLCHVELSEFLPKFPEQYITKFLSTQELTLETLILDSAGSFMRRSDIPFVIPKLSTLKKLHITEEFLAKNLPLTLSPVPNLTKLVLEFTSLPNFKILLPKMKETKECPPHLNIKEIVINKIDPVRLGELSKWFPNVTKILLPNCNDQLLLNQFIYTGCNRVKVLIVDNRSFFNSVTASGILALPYDTIEEIKDAIHNLDIQNSTTGNSRWLEGLLICNIVIRVFGKLRWLCLHLGIAEPQKLKKVSLTDMDSIPNEEVLEKFSQRGFKHVFMDDDKDYFIKMQTYEE